MSHFTSELSGGREYGTEKTSTSIRHLADHVYPTCKHVQMSASITHLKQKDLVYEGCSYFRLRLVLATLSGKPVKITKIREKEDEPGIRGEHATHTTDIIIMWFYV